MTDTFIKFLINSQSWHEVKQKRMHNFPVVRRRRKNNKTIRLISLETPWKSNEVREETFKWISDCKWSAESVKFILSWRELLFQREEFVATGASPVKTFGVWIRQALQERETWAELLCIVLCWKVDPGVADPDTSILPVEFDNCP